MYFSFYFFYFVFATKYVNEVCKRSLTAEYRDNHRVRAASVSVEIVAAHLAGNVE